MKNIRVQENIGLLSFDWSLNIWNLYVTFLVANITRTILSVWIKSDNPFYLTSTTLDLLQLGFEKDYFIIYTIVKTEKQLQKKKKKTEHKALKVRKSIWPKHIGICNFYKAWMELLYIFQSPLCLGFCEMLFSLGITTQKSTRSTLCVSHILQFSMHV